MKDIPQRLRIVLLLLLYRLLDLGNLALVSLEHLPEVYYRGHVLRTVYDRRLLYSSFVIGLVLGG